MQSKTKILTIYWPLYTKKNMSCIFITQCLMYPPKRFVFSILPGDGQAWQNML